MVLEIRIPLGNRAARTMEKCWIEYGTAGYKNRSIKLAYKSTILSQISKGLPAFYISIILNV
jgi:hypothetical protein